jgi:hypothetical protein
VTEEEGRGKRKERGKTKGRAEREEQGKSGGNSQINRTAGDEAKRRMMSKKNSKKVLQEKIIRCGGKF